MVNDFDDSAQAGYPANKNPMLRQMAEEKALEKESLAAFDSRTVSQEEMRQKVHELLVHQIELEMQNEELRCAQEELEEARARYLDLYDLAPMGYFTLDENGLIREANLTAASMLGVLRGALINQPITRFIHRDGQDTYYLYKRQLFETGEPQSFELQMTNGSETFFWASLAANVTQDARGERKCRITISDVTERKLAEEALRTSEAQARVLAEALEKKNRLVTDFFINISHEFKTPLTILMLGLELLEAKAKRMKGGEAFIGNLTAMKQNSYRLNRLVGNLLDITKLDAGFMQPKWEEADAAALLRNLARSVEPYAKLRELALEYGCNPEEIQFTTDSFILERIVLNLLSNAIKHTPADGRIRITCRANGGGVSIAVADTGEGIPHDKKAIIFDRFSQVDTRMTRASEGTGIGLALTKSLVELLGGIILVESSPGAGSTFTVELPYVKKALANSMAEQDNMHIDKRVQMEFSDIVVS